MRLGSLFAGIGGFDLAARWMGWTTSWYSEVDPYACRIMERHFPEARGLGDIRTIRGADVEPIDMLVGGFPCQDISVAGRGAGIEGARSGLWTEFARLIGEIHPRWVVAENVSALRSRGLGAVLKDLDALGYDAEGHCVPASAVGAPHPRDRIWIVAHADGARGEGLVQSAHFGFARPWRWRGEADLCALALAPFERGDRWPQPLLRRVDDGLSGRVDRLRALGNAIVPQVAFRIFQAIQVADERLQASEVAA